MNWYDSLDDDQIESLKGNEKPYGLCSKMQQDAFGQMGDGREVFTGKTWETQVWFETDPTFTYRLRPDWQRPEEKKTGHMEKVAITDRLEALQKERDDLYLEANLRYMECCKTSLKLDQIVAERDLLLEEYHALRKEHEALKGLVREIVARRAIEKTIQHDTSPGAICPRCQYGAQTLVTQAELEELCK